MNSNDITKALNGDFIAFGALIEQHEDRWVRLASAMINRKEDALDAYQEGIIQIHRSLKTFRQEASFTTWSTKIMVNNFIRYRKKLSQQKGREIVHTDCPEVLNIPNSGSVEQNLLRQEMRKVLREGISKLPKKQQLAVTLKYDGEMTIEEVAATMGCSSGTIKRYLYRAMEKLRSNLKQYFK
jgi:RNA polymerase sigma-70 factor (ECF subfamily)